MIGEMRVRGLRDWAILAARLCRYATEVVIVTMALWIPMAAVSGLAMKRLVALLPPPPPSVIVEPSDLPFVVMFLLLIVANLTSRPIVKKIERFWERRGW